MVLPRINKLNSVPSLLHGKTSESDKQRIKRIVEALKKKEQRLQDKSSKRYAHAGDEDVDDEEEDDDDDDEYDEEDDDDEDGSEEFKAVKHASFDVPIETLDKVAALTILFEALLPKEGSHGL